MIPEKAKLQSVIIKDITSKSVSPDSASQRLKQDTLINVEVLDASSHFTVTDGNNIILCKFSKKALFWFKMRHKNMDLNELEGRYLVLSEYSVGSTLLHQKALEVFLEIYSFMLLSTDEAKAVSSLGKKAKDSPKDVLKEPKLQHSLEALRVIHMRQAISKRSMELPNLEEILGNKSTKPTKKKVKSYISDLKSPAKDERQDGKNKIIEPEELRRVEREVSEDVAVIFEQDEKFKSKVKDGSEGNVEADNMLSKVQKLIKDKAIIQMLEDHGTFHRRRSAAKSPVKRGKMPADLEEIVQIIKEDHKERKVSEKRKALEEKSARKKPEKRRAIEANGKKVPAKAKKANRSSKAKSHK
eukprot:TRINITY_DN12571_c0_g4_i1.p1 TRINITY_DN12571_c0_g4~~TRINITY_DN12571_c0_g4_i1.p1  ORF type:complete len:356 (-),score=148.04 TRINITY_DN12571_c0_g4_i1:88-1155(-)